MVRGRRALMNPSIVTNADGTQSVIDDALVPHKAETELIPAGPLSALLKGMPEGERDEVIREAEALARQLYVSGKSRLAIGQHLEAIRKRLEPHNLFSRFLRYFGFNRTIAYRRIAEYQNSMKNLPEVVVRVAMARNINILGESKERPLGIYTDAVKVLPPPPEPTEDEATVYLDQLEKLRKKIRSEEVAA